VVRSCSPSPKPETGGPPFFGCAQLPIQYIRTYPPHLQAVCCNRKLSRHHALVTGTRLLMHRQISVVCLCQSVLQNGPPSRQLNLMDMKFTPDAARLYTANKEFSNKLSKNSVIGYITASLLTIPPTPAFFEAC
jgi:hypothetical protein